MSIVDDVRIHQDWGEDGYRFEIVDDRPAMDMEFVIETEFCNPVFVESMERMSVLTGASYREIEQRILQLLTTPLRGDELQP